MLNELKCPHCGGMMERRTLNGGCALNATLGIISLAIGISLFFSPLFWLGIPLCIFALYIIIFGINHKPVWMCKSCGSIIERA
ncbi:MAG: hypothetical protein JXR78_01850 [Victivallales bacterium]|nr:hypothetical protein [Victivallales bacterium]